MVLQIGTGGFIGELASCPWPGRVPNAEMRTPFAFPWQRNLRTEGSFQSETSIVISGSTNEISHNVNKLSQPKKEISARLTIP